MPQCPSFLHAQTQQTQKVRICTYLAIYNSNQSNIKDSKLRYLLGMHKRTNNNETFVAQFLQKGITLPKIEAA
jgi:hypothetical protein